MSRQKNRLWDCEIKLLSETTTTNANGFEIKETSEVPLYANSLPVHSSEFYQSSQKGYIIAKVFEIHSIEFDGQTMLKYEDEIYRIKRLYEIDDFIELSCERRDDSL